MKNELINFSKALEAIQNGHKISRDSWGIQGGWIELKHPILKEMTKEEQEAAKNRGYVKVYSSFIEQITPRTSKLKDALPRMPTQQDLLAFDWYVVE